MGKLESREYRMDEVMEWDEPEWLVEGLVHKESMVFLSAAPKTGKSLFALRLAAAVSSGTPLFGHQCEQGDVLYIAAERARLMNPRVRALVKSGIPIDFEHLRVWPTPVEFMDHEQVAEFVNSLTAHPKLLIVDTLRRCYTGDESDNPTMTRWCEGVELFCNLTGASAFIIHHNHRERRDTYGRPIEGDYSGAGALLGSADAQFTIRHKGDELVAIETEAANEGNHFTAYATTVPVELDKHTTWVMIEGITPTVDDKPQLNDLVREVLIDNPSVTLKRLAELCREDAEIAVWWPDLDDTTVSRILKKWVKSGLVDKTVNPAHKQQHFHTWIGEEKTAAA